MLKKTFSHCSEIISEMEALLWGYSMLLHTLLQHRRKASHVLELYSAPQCSFPIICITNTKTELICKKTYSRFILIHPSALIYTRQKVMVVMLTSLHKWTMDHYIMYNMYLFSFRSKAQHVNLTLTSVLHLPARMEPLALTSLVITSANVWLHLKVMSTEGMGTESKVN